MPTLGCDVPGHLWPQKCIHEFQAPTSLSALKEEQEQLCKLLDGTTSEDQHVEILGQRLYPLVQACVCLLSTSRIHASTLVFLHEVHPIRLHRSGGRSGAYR